LTEDRKPVSEIACELGFKYPHLHRNKLKTEPLLFRYLIPFKKNTTALFFNLLDNSKGNLNMIRSGGVGFWNFRSPECVFFGGKV